MDVLGSRDKWQDIMGSEEDVVDGVDDDTTPSVSVWVKTDFLPPSWG